jgi:DNA-directed RNA polymerase subunit RPC12/RpoP
LSENIDELNDGQYRCLDCGHRFGEDEAEEENESREWEADKESKEDSEEDSEGDGLMMGDSMFPPEFEAD